MAHFRRSGRPTVYPPAVWRHLADAAKTDEEFVAELVEHRSTTTLLTPRFARNS